MRTTEGLSSLPRSAPGRQGVSADAVRAFVQEIEAANLELHSFMLLRHGYVVAEGWWSPYAPQYPHMLYSLSKSFTSTAAGMLAAEGKLSLEATVASFFPDDLPATVNDNLAGMRVRHLLTMTSGHSQDTLGTIFSREDGNWGRGFLSQPVEHVPGLHFVYNSGATYMVSAIVQKITGQRLLDYLQPRLFAPLGIVGATWETCPRGINTGGWGLMVKTEDIARFGQLYLQKGVWNGKRLLPEEWVLAATSAQVPNGDPASGSDWNQGYGYQFWRCRHGAYRGDGAFGQYCVVMPQQDAVLAITSGVGDMQAVLNMVWKHLLPAMKPEPLPEQSAKAGSLRRFLNGLTIRSPKGDPSSPMAPAVSGKTYRFAANDQKIESVTLECGADRSVLRIRDQRQEHRIACGHAGEWLRGRTSLDNPEPRSVAASGAWTSADTFTARLCFYETPYIPTVTLQFAGDAVKYNFRPNVGFGPVERPTLEGKRE